MLHVSRQGIVVFDRGRAKGLAFEPSEPHSGISPFQRHNPKTKGSAPRGTATPQDRAAGSGLRRRAPAPTQCGRCRGQWMRHRHLPLPAAPAGDRPRAVPLRGTTHLRGTGAAGGGASSRRRSGSPCCRLFPCSRCQAAPRRLPPLLGCLPAGGSRDSPYRRASARLTSPTPPFCFALLYLT